MPDSTCTTARDLHHPNSMDSLSWAQGRLLANLADAMPLLDAGDTMSLAGAVIAPFLPELASLNSEELAQLATELVEDYSVTETDPTTGELRLTERYRPRLGRDTAEYVLELTRSGMEREAAYVANCRMRGTVHAQCPGGDYAKAYQQRCHDPGCKPCGRAFNRLFVWLRTRSIDKLMAEPQVGLELTIPLDRGSTEEALPGAPLDISIFNRVVTR